MKDFLERVTDLTATVWFLSHSAIKGSFIRRDNGMWRVIMETICRGVWVLRLQRQKQQSAFLITLFNDKLFASMTSVLSCSRMPVLRPCLISSLIFIKAYCSYLARKCLDGKHITKESLIWCLKIIIKNNSTNLQQFPFFHSGKYFLKCITCWSINAFINFAFKIFMPVGRAPHLSFFIHYFLYVMFVKLY